MERKYNDLIGDMLKKSGDKDNYQGKGKGKPIPSDYLERDIYQHFQKVAKDAGFLPPWLELQKEISALIHACKTEQDIEIINEKIKDYNKICPIPMQKGIVSLDNLEAVKKRW